MPTEKLKLETSDKSGLISVKVQGILNFFTVAQFRENLDTWVQTGTRKIELDLSGMKFIDSAGVGVLLQGIRSCQERNMDFKIINAPKPFENVIKMSGLTGLL